nr:hypothetical protein CFP56_15221 [Quercus suber]
MNNLSQAQRIIKGCSQRGAATVCNPTSTFSSLPVSFCDPTLIISVFSISVPVLFIQDWEESIVATFLASIPDGSYKRRKHLFVAYP